MAKQMTADEIVASLKHSHLNDVVVEGTDDMEIYSKIEKELYPHSIIFFPCGGRDTLLQVAKRRSEFPNHKKIFIADQDMWIFSSIPSEYEHVFFTKGYSIENDLFADGEERLNELLYSQEIKYKNDLLQNVITWFAFEVEVSRKKPANNHFAKVNLLNEKYINKNDSSFSELFLSERNFSMPDEAILSEIQKSYAYKLRGKFLFQIWLKIFQHIRFKKETTYTIGQLWDMCFHIGKQKEDSCVNQIIHHICQTFNIKK